MNYKKWRDLSIDPYTIEYQNIRIKKIINYFPAGNDVLECIYTYNGEDKNLILKIERSKMANFKAELRTIKYLYKTSFAPLIPQIIENGKVNDKQYLILEKKEGRRLSELIKINNIDRNKYLYKYGQSLAQLHLLKPKKMHEAKQRIINDIPSNNDYKNISSKLLPHIKYLKDNKPSIEYNTFIHGDYHYANILWKKGDISGILDFEYSGLGFKEQDIAWAITYRPSQLFLDNHNDIKEFLKGYLSINDYNKQYLKWCLINAYCHFYIINHQNTTYTTKLLDLINDIDKIIL